MRFRLLFWAVVIVAGLLVAWLAVRQWGLVGALVAPVAIGTAAIGAVAKSATSRASKFHRAK